MADNVTFTAAADATPPGGTKAATDELSDGSHAGIGKLAVSADGDRTLIPATAADGLLVEVSNPTAGTGLTDAELRATPVPVSGTVSVTEPVSVDDNGGSLTVDNAALSVVGGGTEAAAQRVTIANDSTGVLSVDDNGGSLTVDGPLTDAQLRATPVPVSGTVTTTGGGTAMPDGDPFAQDVDEFTPIGGRSGIDSTVAAGDGGVAQITPNRAIHVNLRDAGGTEIGDSTDDPLIVSTGGAAQPVSGTVSISSVVPGTGATNLGKAEDAVHTSGDVGVMPLAVRQDTPAALAANGDYIPLGTDSVGALRVTTVQNYSQEAGGNLESAALSLQVMDDWDESDRAKVNPIVGQAGLQGGSGTVSANTQRVVLATDVALPAGTNAIGKLAANSGIDIGDVDVTSVIPGVAATNLGKAEDAVHTTGDTGVMALAVRNDSTSALAADGDYIPLQLDFDALKTASRLYVQNSGGSFVAVSDATGVQVPIKGTVTANQGTAGTAWEVVGDVAQDAAIAGNPLPDGGRASAALPTAMSADGDSVYQWLTRNGAAVQALLPHLGTFAADPYTLTAVTAQYTSTQTSTILINPGAAERIAITSIQIQVGGTTAGTLQVYFGTGAYSRGSNLAIFDGEFAPSATLKPGFALAPPKPWVAATANDDLRVTTSAAINPLTITVWYYLI